MATANNNVNTQESHPFQGYSQDLADRILAYAQMPVEADGTAPDLLIALRGHPCFANVARLAHENNYTLTLDNIGEFQGMCSDDIAKISHLRISFAGLVAYGPDHQSVQDFCRIASGNTLWKMRNYLKTISIDLTDEGAPITFSNPSLVQSLAYLMAILASVSHFHGRGVEFLEVRFGRSRTLLDPSPRMELLHVFFEALEHHLGYPNALEVSLFASGRWDGRRETWTWGDGMQKLKKLS